MNNSFAVADIVSMFESILSLCKVKKGEVVLIFTDPQFPYQMYPPAAFAAAHNLEANVYVMMAQSEQAISDKLCIAAWENADLIIGMSILPRGIGSWMYTETHNRALKSGARTLMVQSPIERMRRMIPNETVRKLGIRTAKMLSETSTIHLVSKIGTDLYLQKNGREAGAQWGISDVPGRFDHWPSGLVACAPLKEGVEGKFVISPGDVLESGQGGGLWKFVTSKIVLSFKEGRLVEITGGPDSNILRSFLAQFKDGGARRVAHIGWGIDYRANWSNVGIESESLGGAITLALGRNTFTAPAQHCGLSGDIVSELHLDISTRQTDVFLDNKQLIKEEQFISL